MLECVRKHLSLKDVSGASSFQNLAGFGWELRFAAKPNSELASDLLVSASISAVHSGLQRR